MTTPRDRRSSVPHALTLAAGLFLGWGLAGSRPMALQAHGGDRQDDSVLTTGPAFIKYNEGSKIQVAQDAIYYLDYKAGKLFGTIPAMRQTVGESRILAGFSERDLATDFKLDTETGARPRFLMTTGSMSSGSGNTYGDGWAPLFVFEATTRQVAVYKIQLQTVGLTSQVKLDLLERRPFAARIASAR